MSFTCRKFEKTTKPFCFGASVPATLPKNEFHKKMCKAYVLQDLHYLSLKAGGGGSALEGAETRGPSDVLEVEAEALGPGPEFPESRIIAKLAQSAKFKFCKF